jgi:2-amino-4-hydroxy-6-hydroxymethyldihydropteridine diphosphokinase
LRNLLPMNGVFLLLGSNLGNRKQNLEQAIQKINLSCGSIVKQGSFYETAPWGKLEQANFLNVAVEISTLLNPKQLLQNTLKIEEEMGRIRLPQNQWGERLIDIDILYFGDMIVNEENLQIPHPRIAQRRFALVPMAEIAADFVHPKLAKTQTELLDACPDKLDVHWIN